MIRIAAVGDIMPGGILAGIDSGWVSSEVLSVLKEADIRVGTLETAIGNEPTFYGEKMRRLADVIYAKDQDLIKIKQLGIDIVSLANNHFFDLGPDGADHTIQLLDELGIKHIGAGRNLEEASRPVVEKVKRKKMVFMAFCDWRNETVGWCPFAKEEFAGVNPMYEGYVVDEIKKYKKQADYVVVIPHWGQEHTWMTTNHVYVMAKKMIKAGADLILGGHPHRVQPVVNFKHTSIAFSMGNFLFPDRLIIKPRSTFYPEKAIDISLLPVTDAYPYVEELTLKKWTYLARVGMIVKTELDNNRVCSSYSLTFENEEGVVSLFCNHRIDSILNRRKFLLLYSPYYVVYLVEKYGKAFLRRLGFK